eukprot:9341266-Pyramimonas_sp.AAC.1
MRIARPEARIPGTPCSRPRKVFTIRVTKAINRRKVNCVRAPETITPCKAHEIRVSEARLSRT